VWFVIASSHNTIDDARMTADGLRGRGFTLQIYEQSGGYPYPYAVVIGANLTEADARELRDRAMLAGLTPHVTVWQLPL
jgi:hypothetical protein